MRQRVKTGFLAFLVLTILVSLGSGVLGKNLKTERVILTLPVLRGAYLDVEQTRQNTISQFGSDVLTAGVLRLTMALTPKEGGRYKATADATILGGKARFSFSGEGPLDPVMVGSQMVLIGYLDGYLNTGEPIALGVHYCADTKEGLVTTVTGYMDESTPVRLQFGKPGALISEAVKKHLEGVKTNNSLQGIDSTIRILSANEFVNRGTTVGYISGSYKCITVGLLTESDCWDNNLYAISRVWSHSADVLSWYDTYYVSPYGPGEDATETYVCQSKIWTDYGTSHNWECYDEYYWPTNSSPLNVSLNFTAYPGPISISVSYPLNSGITCAEEDNDWDGWHEACHWYSDSAQTNAETDLSGSGSSSTTGNLGKVGGQKQDSGSWTQTTTAKGQLKYCVTIVVNNDDLHNFTYYEYYTSSIKTKSYAQAVN